MRCLAIPALLLLAALPSACSSLPRAIDDADERLGVGGGGTVGVPGVGWTLVSEEGGGIVFVRGDEETQRSFVASAGVKSVGTFADLATLRDHLQHEVTTSHQVDSAVFEVVDGGIDGRMEAAGTTPEDEAIVRRVLTRTHLLADGQQLVISVVQTAPKDAGFVAADDATQAFLRSFKPNE